MQRVANTLGGELIRQAAEPVVIGHADVSVLGQDGAKGDRGDGGVARAGGIERVAAGRHVGTIHLHHGRVTGLRRVAQGEAAVLRGEGLADRLVVEALQVRVVELHAVAVHEAHAEVTVDADPADRGAQRLAGHVEEEEELGGALADLGQVAIQVGVHGDGAACELGIASDQDLARDVHEDVGVDAEGLLGGIRIIQGGTEVQHHVADHVGEADRSPTRLADDVADLTFELSLPLVGAGLRGVDGGGDVAQLVSAGLRVHFLTVIDDRLGDGGTEVDAAANVGDGDAADRLQDDRHVRTDEERQRAEVAEGHANFQTAHTRDFDLALQADIEHAAGDGRARVRAWNDVAVGVELQKTRQQRALHARPADFGFHADVEGIQPNDGEFTTGERAHVDLQALHATAELRTRQAFNGGNLCVDDEQEVARVVVEVAPLDADGQVLQRQPARDTGGAAVLARAQCHAEAEGRPGLEATVAHDLEVTRAAFQRQRPGIHQSSHAAEAQQRLIVRRVRMEDDLVGLHHQEAADAQFQVIDFQLEVAEVHPARTEAIRRVQEQHHVKAAADAKLVGVGAVGDRHAAAARAEDGGALHPDLDIYLQANLAREGILAKLDAEAAELDRWIDQFYWAECDGRGLRRRCGCRRGRSD